MLATVLAASLPGCAALSAHPQAAETADPVATPAPTTSGAPGSPGTPEPNGDLESSTGHAASPPGIVRPSADESPTGTDEEPVIVTRLVHCAQGWIDFLPGETTIANQLSHRIINHTAQTIQNSPEIALVAVEGYSVESETAAADAELGYRQASVVADELVSLGIDRARLAVVGCGRSGAHHPMDPYCPWPPNGVRFGILHMVGRSASGLDGPTGIVPCWVLGSTSPAAGDEGDDQAATGDEDHPRTALGTGAATPPPPTNETDEGRRPTEPAPREGCRDDP